ncbi:MAG TPA: 6-phospho-beta-glucosidase [Armatimonadota bacterium]
MIDGITLCIVGAGSSYTPELIDGLLTQSEEQLPVREIRMHDLNTERLSVMAGLAARMIAHSGRQVILRSGGDLASLLPGADFVITQIRVGGMPARHLDETIPLKYGIVGQETTGPGGMFKALRTIPPMLEIARAVEKHAPQAFILNYTNPSGIITEAVRRHTGARLIGLCAGVPSIQAKVRELLLEEFGETRSYCVGLNHLGFVYRFLAGDEDISERAIARLIQISTETEGHGGLVPAETIRAFDAVPLGYAHYYLKRRLTIDSALAREKTRAEQIMETEREVFAQAADPASTGKPAALARRGGGGYASITFSMLRAILHDTGEEIACTVLNGGAVDGIADDAGVEIVCRVDRNGPTALPVGPIPLAFRGLVQAVKAYETLTVEAAVTRNRHRVVQALLNHPLAGDLDVIEPMVDEMLAAHGLAYT